MSQIRDDGRETLGPDHIFEKQGKREPISGRIKRVWTVGEASRIIATVFVAASISFGSAAAFTITQVHKQNEVTAITRCQDRVDDRNNLLAALGAIIKKDPGSPATAAAPLLRVHPCPTLANKVHGDDQFTTGPEAP